MLRAIASRAARCGAIVPLLFVTVLTACAVDEDAPEIVQAEMQAPTVTDIDVGYGITRYQEKICGRKCVRSSDEDTVGGTHLCLEWADDCGAGSIYVGLFGRSIDLGSPRYFQGKPELHPQSCGPLAAQKVLSFYGLDFSIDFIRSWIRSYPIPFSEQIATLPDDLASGLGGLLNTYGDGTFDVQAHSGVTAADVKAFLAMGSPVIMLVHKGTHYVTATAYWAPPGFDGSFFVSDDKHSRIEDYAQLDLDFPQSIPGTSYKARTIITVRQRDPMCACHPGASRACGGRTRGLQYCETSCQWSPVCTYANEDQVPPAPKIALDYTGCQAGTNSFSALVAAGNVVEVTSFDKSVRIGSGPWTPLSSTVIRAPSRQSVSVEARACNKSGCSGYASKSIAGPLCQTGGGGVAF